MVFFTYDSPVLLTVPPIRKLGVVFSAYGSPTKGKRRQIVSKKTATVGKKDASELHTKGPQGTQRAIGNSHTNWSGQMFYPLCSARLFRRNIGKVTILRGRESSQFEGVSFKMVLSVFHAETKSHTIPTGKIHVQSFVLRPELRIQCTYPHT